MEEWRWSERLVTSSPYFFPSLRFSVMETFSPLFPPVTRFFTSKLARISHQTGRLFLNIFKIEVGVGGRVGVGKVF